MIIISGPLYANILLTKTIYLSLIKKNSFMTMKITGIVMAIIFFAACNNKNDNNDGMTMNATDQQFLQQVSYSNHDEVAAGQIASTKGTADSVKIFAQMMISDHTTAQASLDSLGGQYNMQLPQGPDSAHIAFGLLLGTLSGYTFDTTYMSAQVSDHQLTLGAFQNEIDNGNNVQVKGYATKNLPIIQEHLMMAQRIQTSL